MSWGEGYREGLEEGYERAIRAVVAAQWIAMVCLAVAVDGGDYCNACDDEALRVYVAHDTVLTAEQIVDGVA